MRACVRACVCVCVRVCVSLFYNGDVIVLGVHRNPLPFSDVALQRRLHRLHHYRRHHRSNDHHRHLSS